MSGPTALTAPLAQHGGAGTGGETIMTIFLIGVLAVIWIALGVVCWIFWRAKKREDAERERGEVDWPNARSS
jgi:cbb3-type cytochrome oxidase subunit 3